MLEQHNQNRKPGAAPADMVRARKSPESFAGAGRLFGAQVDEVPTLRVPRRPQSSRHSFSGTHEFRMLPPLTGEDYSDAERKELFQQKLVQCTVVFDFQNPDENIDGKEAKQRTLGEILDYISSGPGAVTLDLYPKLFKMVSANLFRTIPPQINAFGDPFDPEEDEPREEPAWPHLCLVYHIFLRFLESGDFNNSAARPYIDQSFTTQLLELFDCEDVRERESLKTVLHRIYGKMLGMRSFIRRSINNIFLQFVYETQRHNGIAELLEILGSIINGFTVPLKDEHISFLHRVLLPLHKARPMGLYYAQLTYCTVQFLEKDPKLADIIVRALLRYWPKVNSPKEVMFVNEIEGVVDVMEPAQFTTICQPLFQQLIRCVVSPHFQIAERTLGMWRNSYFVSLITENKRLLLPIALSGIYRHSRSHWNRNIHNQVYQILRFFVNADEKIFEQSLADFRRQRDLERKQSKRSIGWWTNIERLAMEKAAQDAQSPAGGSQPASTAAGSVASPQTAAGQDASADSSPAAAAKAPGAATPADSWAERAADLPLSKLDDPDTMCCEMDEDEFIQELDKFVDIIKSEDPETALANGAMLFDESDGSGAVDDMISPDLHGTYAYAQPGQYGHQHGMLLHDMMADGNGMAAQMVMDPPGMHLDYAMEHGNAFREQLLEQDQSNQLQHHSAMNDGEDDDDDDNDSTVEPSYASSVYGDATGTMPVDQPADTPASPLAGGMAANAEQATPPPPPPSAPV